MGHAKHAANTTAHADRGVLGYGSNPEARFIRDHATLRAYVEALKTLGMKIVLTSGTFDLIHVGHARYMERAKSYGDVLIVGVDSDAKVKKRKGPTRPIVPEEERVQMLAFLRSVDLITLKHIDDPKWNLIKLVEPDTQKTRKILRQSYSFSSASHHLYLRSNTTYANKLECKHRRAAYRSSSARQPANGL